MSRDMPPGAREGLSGAAPVSRERARERVSASERVRRGGGQNVTKNFLLQKSRDLDALIPMVPVAQKVHRQKYFFSDVRM